MTYRFVLHTSYLPLTTFRWLLVLLGDAPDPGGELDGYVALSLGEEACCRARSLSPPHCFLEPLMLQSTHTYSGAFDGLKTYNHSLRLVPKVDALPATDS